MAIKKFQPGPGPGEVKVSIGFGAALRKLSGLAESMAASGALTEMSGPEFIAYGAEQLALASIEPKDASAARLSALKSAIDSAAEQNAGTTEAPVVYVKLYDSDDAGFARVETLLSACKSALELLRPPADTDTAGSDDSRPARPSPARAKSGDPIRDAYADDEDDDEDLDSDVFEEMEPPRRRTRQEEIDAYDEEDQAELEEFIAARNLEPLAPARTRRTASAPRRLSAPAPAAPRAAKRAPAAVKQAPPPKLPPPRPMTAVEMANALARGEKGGPRLQTSRSMTRGR